MPPSPVLSPAPAVADGEFAFGAADFERVRQLIHRRAGISLHDGKQAMVYSRLSRRLRETGHRSFADYLRVLEAANGAAGEAEWQEFVNCLTTNLTAFFREEHHFQILAGELRAARSRLQRIWCCAASTGEEPWSIAMTVLESAPAPQQVRILASDIDTKVLATAQRGVYDADAKGLSAERLKRHFLRGTGPNAGRMKVRPELSRLVEFFNFNLMSERWELGEPLDLVFCRNVMIYFDGPTQMKVLRGLHRAMRPGALLCVGHSENFGEARELFRLRGKTVYERL